MSWMWRFMRETPALENLRQEDCCKFETSLGYKGMSKSALATE